MSLSVDVSRELSGSPSTMASTGWRRHDTHWVISLFGTAVGAGILFLPINLGLGGIWPLIIVAVLAGPMTFLAHRGLARFVLSSSRPQADFTEVAEEHFGKMAGRLISALYFLSIFPILLIYGVGLTNTVESFMVNQLGLASPDRVMLSGVLVFAMIAVMLAGEKAMLRAFAVMVYPLAAILLALSCYLIPQWQWQWPEVTAFEGTSFLNTVWLALPVTVFAFSHAAAISGFANVQRREYGEQAETKSGLILRNTTVMLVGFVLFFVFSCVLSLSPAQLAEAKAQNVSVLSYLANITDNPVIVTLGPLIAFIAISSSFLGHFLGARESLKSLIAKATGLPLAKADKLGIALMFFAIWGAAIINPGILGLMETLSGPVIAMILFIMPVVAIYKVEALARFRHRWVNGFILLTGALAVSALLFSLLK
ncbi:MULTISPECIES: aromatic amino acid transport family protein [Aeromonas]|uniref:aromatic amino acid transport family protein n=1 Tax=Aeromonas TaxID=642 RepID=UPI0005A8D7CF|nr:aromatic amino acid transport family protein [Aeromonas caviae]MBS4635363.1 HAAAP family serine/threonine permease [Aeromonas caviae]WQD89676.1 aromatic amino acid transport family protein [Aeromonas caviae]SQH58165.1 serine transporter [Aeromonas caviae]